MTRTMPARPNDPHMTGADLRALIAAAGLKQGEAAGKLGVARTTVIRWLNGSTPIGKANATLIKSVLKPKKK